MWQGRLQPFSSSSLKLLLNKHEKIIFPGPGPGQHAWVSPYAISHFPTLRFPPLFFPAPCVCFGLLSSIGNAVLVQSSCHIDAFACQTMPTDRPQPQSRKLGIKLKLEPQISGPGFWPDSLGYRPQNPSFWTPSCGYLMVTYHDFSINSTSMPHFAHWILNSDLVEVGG